jgi:hypothetical protein
MTSSPAFPTGMGTCCLGAVAEGRHAINAIAEAPTSPSERCQRPRRETPLARPVRGRPRKTDAAHRPSWGTNPVRYASVDTATQGPTARQGDTRWDREETARQHENSQLPGRFRGWWQVLGSNQRRLSRRFYRPPSSFPSPSPLTSAYTLGGVFSGSLLRVLRDSRSTRLPRIAAASSRTAWKGSGYTHRSPTSLSYWSYGGTRRALL